MDQLGSLLTQEEYVAPATPPEADTPVPLQEREEVLGTMASATDGDGSLSELPAELAGPEALDIDEDPFVKTVTEVMTDPSTNPDSKAATLFALETQRVDDNTPEAKARKGFLAVEENIGADIIDRERAARVGDDLLRANEIGRLLQSAEDEIKGAFPTIKDTKGQKAKAALIAERGLEFFFSDLFPPTMVKSTNYDVVKLVQYLTDTKIELEDYAVLGDAYGRARLDFMNMPREEQVRRLKGAASFILKTSGTFGTDNKFEAERQLTVLQGIVGNWHQYSAGTAVTLVEPVINMMTGGTAGVVGSAIVKGGKGAIKGVAKAAPLKIAAEIAPEASEAIVKAAAEDVSGKTARAMGADRAEVLDDYAAPLGPNEPVLRGPDLNFENVSADEVTEQIQLLRNQTDLVTPAESRAAFEALNLKAQKVGSAKLSKSELYRDEFGNFRAKYRISPYGKAEFSTWNEAADYAAKKIEGHQLQDVKILRLDPDSRSYNTDYKMGPDQFDEPYGYMLEVDFKHAASDAALGTDIFRQKTFTWLDKNLDTTTVFNKRNADGITGVEITTAQVEDILTKVIKPYKNLNKGKQTKVGDVIKQGNLDGKLYDPADLLTKFGGDQSMVKAYDSVRKVMDIEYNLNNIKLRTHLQSGGFRQVTREGVSSFVKPATKAVRDVTKEGFDLKTGKMRKLTPKDVLLDTFSPRKYFDEAGEPAVAKYVIAEPRLIRPLDQTVFPRRDGYLNMHSEAKWVVRKEVTGSNGQTISTPVKFGENATDMHKYAARKGDGYKVFNSREVDTGSLNIQQEAELLADLDMLGHTKARTDLHRTNESYRESLLDPSEAVGKTIQTISRQAGIDDWVRYHVNTWEKAYGSLTANQSKVMPWGKLDFKKGMSTEEKELAEKAKVLHHRIKLIAGMEEETLSRKLQDTLIYAADGLAKMAIDVQRKDPTGRIAKVKSQLLRGLSRTADTGSAVDLVQNLKEIHFLQFIVFSPLRQFVLQASTSTMYLGVEGGMKYASSMKMGRDVTFLAATKMSTINDNLFAATVKTYAKTTGQTEAQVRQFYKDFDDSGLLGSIDGHQFMEYAEKKVIADKVSVGGVKRLSENFFRGGESMNLITAYATVRNKHVQRLGRDNLTPAEKRAVVIEAKQVGGNMGQANKAAFQQGIPGMMFQFQSHNVRMAQMLMPSLPLLKKLQMPAVVDASARRRMRAVQAVLWGAGGMGMVGLYRENKDSFPWADDGVVNDIMEEGLIGAAIENTFEAVAGDEADINVSGNFAPLGGVASEFVIGDQRGSTPIGTVVEAVHTQLWGGGLSVKDLLGPTGRVVEDPLGIFKTAIALWDSPAFSTPEKAAVQMQLLSEFFPIINDAYQARLANNLGMWTDSLGNPIVSASYSEVIAKQFLSVESENVEAIYNLRSQLNAQFVGREEPEDNEIRTSAKDQARFLISITNALDSGTLKKQEYLERLESAMVAARMTYPRDIQFKLFTLTMKSEAEKLFKQQGTTLEEAVLQQLIDDKETHAESSYEKTMKRLKRLNPTPAVQAAIDAMPKWYGDGSGPSQDEE